MVYTRLKVIEIGSSAATAYCSRLFADFGARVTKVESPQGDPLRNMAPLTAGGQSAWYGFLNYNKQIVTLEADAGEQLQTLLRDCDILIDGRGVDNADCPLLDAAQLLAERPAVIHLNANWFGSDGPYTGFRGSDLIVRALGGLVQLCGPVEGPPCGAPDFQSGIFAGLWGFIAVAAELLAKEDKNACRSYELSIFESVNSVAEYIVAEAFSRGPIMQRLGVNRFWPSFPIGVYKTSDGWLGITTITPEQWKSFCAMVGMADEYVRSEYFIGEGRLPHAAELEAAFVDVLASKPTNYWFQESLRRKLPIVPVPQPAEILADEEKKQRGAVLPITYGNEVAQTIASPLRLQRTPPTRHAALEGHRPALKDFSREEDSRSAAVAAPASIETRLPLNGITVVDFSMGWAGPLCTRTFADLGATVIKVEACQYPDWWRGVDRRPAYVASRAYEKNLRFCAMNRSKKGVTLDLTSPLGRDLALRLVADADLVVENYSAGVMHKLGLSYDKLKQVNPKVVMVSMSAFGAESRFKDCRAYGSTLEHASGLPSVVGHDDGPPTITHNALGDPLGGLSGAAAALVALAHARATGEGQKVDLSLIESTMPLAAPWILAASTTGQPPVRYGTRHPNYAPSGCFPCLGEDSWIALSITSDAMWGRLCALMGRQDWSADPTLATAEGRAARAEEIEAAIAQWTSDRDADALMFELQATDIAAGAVRHPADVVADPHLKARGFYHYLEREFVGLHPVPSLPIRQGGRPFSAGQTAPTLGQHNAPILKGRLGLSQSEYDELERLDIIGTRMFSDEDLRARPKKS